MRKKSPLVTIMRGDLTNGIPDVLGGEFPAAV